MAAKLTVIFFYLPAFFGLTTSYQLVYRSGDTVINPQYSCYDIYGTKIAKEDDIEKYRDQLDQCVPRNTAFWIGPMSKIEKNRYQGIKCRIIDVYSISTNVTCVKDEEFPQGSPYLCRTDSNLDLTVKGGTICLPKPTESNLLPTKTDSKATTTTLATATAAQTATETTSTNIQVNSTRNITSTIGDIQSTTNVQTFMNENILHDHDSRSVDKQKVTTTSEDFLTRHQVQVGIVLGTLLFIVLLLTVVALLLKLKRRHRKLKRESMTLDPHRIEPHCMEGDIISTGDGNRRYVLSREIEIFDIEDNNRDHNINIQSDYTAEYVYNHLQRSVSDTIINHNLYDQCDALH